MGTEKKEKTVVWQFIHGLLAADYMLGPRGFTRKGELANSKLKEIGKLITTAVYRLQVCHICFLVLFTILRIYCNLYGMPAL